jgi:RNA polymerase sigma-70 factor (ECF subfamily)
MITNVTSLSAVHAGARGSSDQSGVAARESLDTELIARIAAGNRLAMQVLYTRFNKRVYRFALRLVGSESTAEDVVSEVFLDVWRKAGTFEGRAQVSTWLLGITRNKALDTRKQRSTEALDEAVAETIEDPANNPEVEIQKKDMRAVMRKCLAEMSPVHREIIDLVYYHGKSIDDVAKITGVGHATVKTRMFYARKRLADLLRANGIANAAA